MHLDITHRPGETLTPDEQGAIVAAYHAAFVEAAGRREFDPEIVARRMLTAAVFGNIACFGPRATIDALREIIKTIKVNVS